MQSVNGKITGDSLTATEWNQPSTEIQNIITALGITLSSGDLNQLGKALAGYVANGQFYVDSGAADAYVLSPVGSKQAPTSYANGNVYVFVPGNTNTGASTANIGALGVTNIKTREGNDPAAGTIIAGQKTILRYDSTNTWLELVGTEGQDQVSDVLSYTFASDANATLTATENLYGRIAITGAVLTAGRNLVVANTPRIMHVTNGESFTVTVKTSAGSGIAVPAGEALTLLSDGTNVVIPDNVIGDGTNTLSITNVIAGVSKAAVNFNGTGTVAIRSSFNVTSITDNGTGDYTINFTNNLATADYVPEIAIGSGTTGNYFTSNAVAATPTVSALRVVAGTVVPAATDAAYVNVVIH